MQLKVSYNYNKTIFYVNLEARSITKSGAERRQDQTFYMGDLMIEDSLARKAQKQLYKAAKEIKLDHNLLKILEKPMRILKVSIPIKLDNGKTINPKF